MSEHFHFLEDAIGENKVAVNNPSGLRAERNRDATSIPTNSRPKEIEIGIIGKLPILFVFRLDKLTLWGIEP